MYSMPKVIHPTMGLKAHVRAEHSVGKRTFQCFRCHKHFTYYNNLNRHLREFCEQGRDEDEKKRIYFILYECNRCDKCYMTKNGLALHVETIHEQHLRWTCICSANYSHSSNYMAHIKNCVLMKKKLQQA